MKRNIKRGAPLLTAIFLLLAYGYLYNTSVFKPVNIYTGSGPFADSANIEQHLTLVLYSPLGKKLDYTKELLFTGSNARHAFISKVEVQISPYLYQNYQPVLITAGHDSCLLSRAAFAKTGEKYTAHVPLVNNGFGAKVLSVSRWAPVESSLFFIARLLRQTVHTIVLLSICLWLVLLTSAILLLVYVFLISSIVLLQIALQIISPRKLAIAFGILLSSLRSNINAAILNAYHYLHRKYFKYLWHINGLTIIFTCIAIQVYAYKFFMVTGSVHYSNWLNFCFYFLLFITSVQIRYLFPRANMFLSIISIIIVLALVDFALNIANINKHITQRRQGFYVSQYHPSINTWYYTRKPESSFCLCNLEYQFLRTTNNEGLSDITFTINKPNQEVRIMGIGDSFTEGDGTDKDSTYLKWAERMLAANHNINNLKFMNAGTCGSDVVFEYQLLKDKLLKYKPDIVIAAINTTDVEDIMLRGGFERFAANGKLQFRKAPWWEFIYAQNYICRLIVTAILKADWLLITSAKKAELAPLSTSTIQEAVAKMNLLGKQNGFKFVLLVQPFKGEWYDKKYRFDLNVALQQTCTQNNIEMYDALSFYTKQKHISDADVASYYWKIDGHHNAKGYKLLGEAASYKLNQILSADSAKGQLH